MFWVLDTDILVNLVNRKSGHDRIARRMSGRSPGEVRVSAITLAELRFGIEKGAFRSDNEAILTELLDMLQVDDFPVGAATDFGQIKAALLSHGKAIGPYDLLIAAHARHIGAALERTTPVPPSARRNAPARRRCAGQVFASSWRGALRWS